MTKLLYPLLPRYLIIFPENIMMSLWMIKNNLFRDNNNNNIACMTAET